MPWSLWLLPPSGLEGRLAAAVAALSRRHGTAAFEPHLTLLGELPGPEAALVPPLRLLARRLRPFDVCLDEVATGEEPFRCVFLVARETPELMGAHARAREVLGVTTAEPFRPHLSLVYGSLDAQEREAARRDAGDLRASFTVESLHLVDTTGDVVGWRRRERFVFGGA